MFWIREDLIEKLNLSIDLESIQRVRKERLSILEKDSWKQKVEAIRALPDLETLKENQVDCFNDLNADAVEIGSTPLNQPVCETFEDVIRQLMPWRKGPFRLFGIDVDSEWRSNRKWDRIASSLGPLEGKRIVDVGCGNGYYMLRAAAQNPLFVLGLDPSPNFLLQFELFQKYLRNDRLQLELLGFEHLPWFRKTFDVVLCMGILYHHPNPIETLRNLRQTMRIGGTALIESQAIPGHEDIALFPKDRYAKARNVFFVPSASCLANWVSRAGFTDIELIDVSKTTDEEQRRSKHMVFESLADFLDPNDSSKTIEGYPAPHRVVIKAKRTTD